MKKTGALITVLLAGGIIFGLFHEIILNANRVSFADHGDGLKSTFCTVYHLKHDPSYWVTSAMNHPFGESLFFTGNQVVLTNLMKLICDAGWDISDHALGISNLLILLSFVVAALLIYLIFIELDVTWWFASLSSVIIILLSNQWERLSGHYNFAYAHVVPLILYILLRFYKRPGYLLSAGFGLLVLLFSARHPYFSAFIFLLWLPFWIWLPFSDRKRFGKPRFVVSHTFLQFILPFLVFSLGMAIHDHITDRTAYPWGFYLGRMKVEAVFLPMFLPHGKWLDFGNTLRNTGYIGLLGSTVCMAILFSVLARRFSKAFPNVLDLTHHPEWNILFWAGILCLVVAFGFPFSLGWERLLNYTGPFRQIRAVNRFSIPFYYTMTITSFVVLHRWLERSGSWRRNGLLTAMMLFTAYEAVIHLYPKPGHYDNPMQWHSDLHRTGPEHEWLENHDFSDYQSIMPIPYFHVGSENYWVGDGSPVIEAAFAASLATGLPLHGVMMSRTSISQSLMNLDLVWEPCLEYPLLDKLPDRRPLLLIRHRMGELTEQERRLTKKAVLIDESGELQIYRLEIDSMESLIGDRQKELLALACHATYNNCTQGSVPREGLHSICYEDYRSLDGGRFTGALSKPVTFFEEEVADTGTFRVSFWYKGAASDLWPRTVIHAELFGADGTEYPGLEDYFFRNMVLRNGSWGLVEFTIQVREPASTLRLSMVNKYVTKGEMVLDRVLVLPHGSVHLAEEGNRLWVNNRPLAESTISRWAWRSSGRPPR